MQTPPIGIAPPPPARPPKDLAPFALGFRPFFLLAGLSALALMSGWLVLWTRASPTAYYGLAGWHGHEMLYGYGLAVVAGFLLTAVRNWTGLPTPTGGRLATLAGLWLAGRLAPLAYPALPGVLVALLDWLFLPALMAALAGPLWRGQNRANRVFLPLLGAMALANLLIHLEALGLAPFATQGVGLMLNLLLILVTLVGGRVMPFFTEKAVAGSRPRQDPRLERAVYGLLLALLILEPLAPRGWPLALLAGATAIAQGLRLAGWHDRRVWSIPILAVLYVGFGWLVLGLALKALAALGLFPPTLATHALGLGAIGVITLGMMARVSLGHTGRPMRSSPLINLAFLLLNLGALARVFGPLLPGVPYAGVVHLAGTLWLLAFLLFCWVYLPILARPRVDGQPG